MWFLVVPADTAAVAQNRIKRQAHDHPGFRRFAARYGQSIHQLNMRMSVALLRDAAAEARAKEKAEAPTVKTAEQVRKEEALKAKHGASSARRTSQPARFLSIWRRKFRALPEDKAVDLFADVIGDAFILGVAVALVVYEWWKSSQKPDHNAEMIQELKAKLEAVESDREEERKRQESRVLALEEALRGLKDPKTKQPLLPSASTSAPETSPPAS